MIPLLEREMVHKKKWISLEDILDVFAISESTPGAIAVNCATFIGYKVGGFWGSFIATLSLIMPSFILIIIFSFFYSLFKENIYLGYAFWGIKIGVIALISKAIFLMIRAFKKSTLTYVLMGLSFMVAVIFTGINVIYILLSCAVIGILSTFLIKKRKGGEKR